MLTALMDRQNGRRRLTLLPVLLLTKTTFMPSASTGEVQAFYRESGEQRWSNKTMLYRGVSAPVVFPGAVAVGDEDGYVHFLSPRTGEEMARVRLSGPIVTQAQPFSAGAIFQTSKGEVAYLSNR